MALRGPPGDETARRPSVLLVEDEPDLASLYKLWLSDSYTTSVAVDLQRARQHSTDDYDAIVLDRWLPDGRGDHLLTEMRARGETTPVVMVAAVDPGFELLDIEVDGYLTKPIRCGDLLTLLETLIEYRDDDAGRALVGLLAKHASLRAQKAPEELDAHPGFAATEARIDTLRSTVDDHVLAAIPTAGPADGGSVP